MIAATSRANRVAHYIDLQSSSIGDLSLAVTSPAPDLTKLRLSWINPLADPWKGAQALADYINSAAGELPYVPKRSLGCCMVNERWEVRLDESARLPACFGFSPVECFLKVVDSPQDVLVFQEEYTFASLNIVSLVGGMYRLLKGFPRKPEDVGDELGKYDPGDLFCGCVVQCAHEQYLRTSCDGIVPSEFARNYPNSDTNFPMFLAGHKK
jgi:hypothetical protein